MPNADTLYRATMLPSADLGNVTVETQMKDARQVLPLQLPLPTNNSLANRSFRVRTSGRVSATIATTFNLKLYFGISTTIAANTLVFDAGVQSIAVGKSNFELWLDCQWDSDSKTITGRGAGQLASNILGPAILDNNPVSADPNRDSSTFLASGPTYGFTITGQFGDSSSGNHVIVDSFDLELV